MYVKDEKEIVYDIEMQVSHTKELPKRSRYYVERLEEAVKEAKKNREWIEDKRFDDIARIKADNGYRQKLYLEYHII